MKFAFIGLGAVRVLRAVTFGKGLIHRTHSCS
jgi:hypothetical protein